MNKSGFSNGDQLYLRGLDRQRHSITPGSAGSPQSVGIRPQHNSSSPGHLQHQGQQSGQQQLQGQQEVKTQNEDQPQNTSPSKDHRSRSGSKTLKDLFRFRRKSVGTPTGSEFSLPDASNQPGPSTSASPAHAHSSNSSPKRQRSKSTIVPPNLQALPRPHVIPSAVPPIRQRFAKDNFPKWSTPDSNSNPTIVISGVTSSSAPVSTSPPSSLPPMSRILQANLGERRDERRRLSIGPAEFMELYRNRTSSDPRQVEARLAAAKVRNRKLQLTQLDISAPADRVPSPEERLSPTRPKVPITSPDSRSSFPDTIPEHVEVHHGSRNQLLPGSDRMRKKSSGVTSGSQLFGESSYSRRRASEPVKPNLMQLAHLNSIRVQSAGDCQKSSESLGGQSATESNRSNSGSRRVSPSSLGICYPLATPQKYLIWRDEETGTTIYKLPSAQGDESDRMADLEFSENLLYVKLMKRHRCYELMPQSSKLILFEKELPVIEAFHALMYNGIRAAPIWDSNTSEYVGMLTVTDFIQVLLNFYEYPEKMEELENHRISTWRELLFRDSDWWETDNNSQSGNGESRRRRFSGNEALVCADSDDSLFDAITKLHKYNFHRLLVTDMVENNALYILTYKRILYFICLLTDDMQEPSFMSRSIGELDIGTYNNLTTITPETKLIDALTLLVERRISAIPVIDEDHKIVNIYAKEDALNLVNDSLYKKLDNTVHCALESQRECFEGIYLCRRSDSLAQIIEWIVKENVHRLLVVDEEGRLEGLISLFDIVNFLVLKQADDDPDLDDIQPGDVEAEMQF